MDTITLQEQKAWEHYAKIEAENHSLKQQLAKKDKEIKALKYHSRALNKYKKQNERRKERSRNSGKGKLKRCTH